MLVKTNRQFFDTHVGVHRKVGDEFEVTEARYKDLNDKIAGFVTKIDRKTKEVLDPLDNLTIAEIKDLLDKEGIEYNAKAKKEELKALLK